MKKRFIGPGVIVIASAITAILNYFKIPIQVYQQLIAVFVALVVILYSHFLTSSKEFPKYLLLLSATLIVQFLILSSGGLFSPFLILYYIFALGLSFFSLSSSVVFLILTLIDFAIFVFLNPDQLNMLESDPGTILLYIASFLAIIPLSRLLATKYQLKVELVELLSNKVKLGEKILESLDELIIVTDSKLRVISVNGAVERRLSSSRSEIIRRPLFDVLFLRSESGIQLNSQFFSLDHLKSQPSQVLENIFLYSKNSAFPKKVLIKVKSTLDLAGRVDQITFIITDADRAITSSGAGKIDLEEINIREQALLENLKDKLADTQQSDERGMVELLSRMSQDFATINQLENHHYEVKYGPIDIAQIVRKSVTVSTDFALSLKVKLAFELKQNNLEKLSQLIPGGFNISPKDLTSPFFTGLVDIKWFDYLLQKLIDLSLLLASGQDDGEVRVLVAEHSRDELLLTIQVSLPGFSEEQKKQLFKPFYGSLSLAPLKLGSGIEGYLAQKLAQIMNLILTVETVEGKGICFKLLVNRLPRPKSGL